MATSHQAYRFSTPIHKPEMPKRTSSASPNQINNPSVKSLPFPTSPLTTTVPASPPTTSPRHGRPFLLAHVRGNYQHLLHRTTASSSPSPYPSTPRPHRKTPQFPTPLKTNPRSAAMPPPPERIPTPALPNLITTFPPISPPSKPTSSSPPCAQTSAPPTLILFGPTPKSPL